MATVETAWRKSDGPVRYHGGTVTTELGDRVTVLGINLDYGDELSADELRQWIEKNDVPGRQLYDGLGWESELADAFGVKEIPFSVVVDANGDVVAIEAHGKALKKAVLAALQEQ